MAGEQWSLARVREFLDVIEQHNERAALRYDDVIYGFNDVELRRSDLRVVLDLAEKGARDV